MLKIKRFQVVCNFTFKLQAETPVVCGLIAKKAAQQQYLLQKFRQNGDYTAYNRKFHLSTVVQKYNKKSSTTEERDRDDDEDENQFKDERDSKVIKTKVNSLRADLILKSGLSMARNKIETIFYDSKIRVNGKKLPKKSVQLKVGDEVDVIKGFSQTNPSHIVISRVIILAADEHAEDLRVHLRRYKTMLIENYDGIDAFKSSGSTEHT